MKAKRKHSDWFGVVISSGILYVVLTPISEFSSLMTKSMIHSFEMVTEPPPLQQIHCKAPCLFMPKEIGCFSLEILNETVKSPSDELIDRKSTRLNSSHQISSYA